MVIEGYADTVIDSGSVGEIGPGPSVGDRTIGAILNAAFNIEIVAAAP